MILVIYAVIINFFLISLGSISGVCPNLDDTTFEGVENVTDDTDTKEQASAFLNIIMNQCDGLPLLLYLVFQVPLIIGILSVIRSFIGLT